MSVKDGSFENHEPIHDRYNLVYIIMFLAGIGSLLPWNFFITAIPYFEYQLRNTTQDGIQNPDRTPYQESFSAYLAVCSMVPLSITMVVNLFIVKLLSSFARFTIGACTVLLNFVITIALIYPQLNATPFLSVTLICTGLINIGSAFIQSAVFGIGSILPPTYIKACVEGQASAGVMAAIAQIISIASTSDVKTSALAYFLFAVLFLVFACAMTYLLKINAYFKYYFEKENTAKTDLSQLENGGHSKASRNKTTNIIVHSFQDVWVQGLSVLLSLMVTLSLFPTLLHSIQSKYYDPNDDWTSKYFTPVTVFLSFSVFDWVGRTLAGIIKLPRREQKWLLLTCVICRVVFIPFTLFMNQRDHHHLPVVFKHDAYPIILVILLGLTNGYFMSLGMMYGPSFAKPGTAEGAGAAMAIYLALGLSIGVALSNGLIQII